MYFLRFWFLSAAFAPSSCDHIVWARSKVDTDSGSSIHELSCPQIGKMGYGALYGWKSGFRGPAQNFALETAQKTPYFAPSESHLPRARVAAEFELEQKLIQILVALFMTFCAPKVAKWATVLPTATNWLVVDPFKRGTKRIESEEVDI